MIATPVDTRRVTAGPEFAMARGVEVTPGGRLWVSWVGGGDNDQAYLVMAFSNDGGRTWTPPQFRIDPPDRPELRCRARVATLWSAPDGALWFFFDQSMGSFDGRAGVWATVCRAPDAPRPEWSSPVRLWHGAALNKPIVLRNGEWMLPVSLWGAEKVRPERLRGKHAELDPLRGSHVLASRDRGKTWELRGQVRFEPADFDEPQLVELRDGCLWMLARTRAGISGSFSSDHGRTWTPPADTGIAHISSRFHIQRLRSGRLLLIKHGVLGERTAQRSHLTAFLSEDDGVSWRGGLLLDGRTGISYPDAVELAPGIIVATYDRNRTTDAEILLIDFTENEVLQRSFASGRTPHSSIINQASLVAIEHL